MMVPSGEFLCLFSLHKRELGMPFNPIRRPPFFGGVNFSRHRNSWFSIFQAASFSMCLHAGQRPAQLRFSCSLFFPLMGH